MPFVGIIAALIIFGLLYWLVTLIPLPAPFPQIIRVVVIIALVLWLLGVVGVLPIPATGWCRWPGR